MSHRNFSLLVCAVLFSILIYIVTAEITVDVSLSPDEPYTVFLTQKLPNGVFPYGVQGIPHLIVSTNIGIQLCLSEYAPYEDIASCPEGSLFQVFVTDSSSSVSSVLEIDGDVSLIQLYEESKPFNYDFGFQETNTSTVFNLTYLRGGSPYFLSIAPIDPMANTTLANIVVTLLWNTSLCHSGAGTPTGCVSSSNFSVASNNVTIAPNSPSQYYYFDCPFGTSEINLNTIATHNNTAENPANPDSFKVLIRRGAPPFNETFDADFSVNADDQAFGYRILSPFSSRYYFSIPSNSSQTYLYVNFNISITVCQNTICDNNFTDITNLKNATRFNGTGEYQYFLMNKTELLVGVGVFFVNVTAPSIYASFLNLPNEDNNVVSSTGKNVSFIWSQISPQLTYQHYNWWWISVLANPNQNYYLWANTHCPNNCSGNATSPNSPTGNCSLTTGVCSCNDGYSGLWCSPNSAKKKTLAAWKIALIVIACVVFLAIVIGLPVAWYIRKKKRSAYESV